MTANVATSPPVTGNWLIIGYGPAGLRSVLGQEADRAKAEKKAQEFAATLERYTEIAVEHKNRKESPVRFAAANGVAPGPCPLFVPDGEESRACTLLRAAATLPPNAPFRIEDLAVAAWRLSPKTFALNGYPAHADIHRVYSLLCGERGLVKCGALRRTAPNVFLLTEFGRKAVEG